MSDISRRVGKTWGILTQYIRRSEQLAAIRKAWMKAQPQSTPEQLTAIEEQAQYTLPDGWRVVPLNEPLQGGDEYHEWLNRYIRRVEPQPDIRPIESDKTQELEGKTQELEGKTQELPEYTPPEGWRALHVGEELRKGDVRVDDSGACSAVLVTVNGVVPHGRRYIRPIEPEPEAVPVQVREGRWRTRGCGVRDVTRTPPGHELADDFPWWDGSRTFRTDGRYAGFDKAMDLVEYLGPIEPQPAPEPVPETTSEQWANIKEQANTEYTPPEGWRVLAVGERLLDGDMTVTKDGYCYSTDRVGYFVGSNKRYIRRIEQQPEPQPQAEAIVDLRNQLAEAKAMLAGVTQGREYAEANRRRADTIITELQHRISDLETINAELEATVKDKNAKLRERADEFRSEVSYVQNLLGESRQRVTHLEELVGSLRTINEGTEKAFEAAGRQNFDLRSQLTDSDNAKTAMIAAIDDAVWTMVQTNINNLLSILAKLHVPDGTLTPEFYCVAVQAIATLCNDMIQNVRSANVESPQHDAIPPVVAQDCILNDALVQVR